MPYNGSGTFVRSYNWVNDKNSAIPITASRMDGDSDGFATGLSTAICKDGQTIPTANLPMGTFKHTGVADGSARTDYASLGQTQNGTINWVAATGTVDAITAAYSPAITALVDGQICYVRTSGTNTITTPTFSPNGLTARTIVKNGAALAVGEIPKEMTLRYDLAGTRWELAGSSAPFTDTQPLIKGSVDATKLARFEVDGFTTGVTRVFTLPDYNDTLATLAGSEVLYNKYVTDSTFRIIDDGDGSKTLQFQCSGITTGTTRVLTAPNASGTIALTSDITAPAFTTKFTSSDQTITSAGLLTLAHSLGAIPFDVQLWLVCQTGEAGYSAGDLVKFNPVTSSSGTDGQGAVSRADATNVYVRYGSAAQPLYINNGTTGATTLLTNAYWKLRVKAWV